MAKVIRNNRTFRAGNNKFFHALLAGIGNQVFPAGSVVMLDPTVAIDAPAQFVVFADPVGAPNGAVAILATDEEIVFGPAETSRRVSFCIAGDVYGDMIDYSGLAGVSSVDGVIDNVAFPGVSLRMMLKAQGINIVDADDASDTDA